MDSTLTGRFSVSYKFLEPKKTDKVLSVGCRAAVLESKIINEVSSIDAIDIDEKIISENKVNFPKINFSVNNIIKGTNFLNNTFDKIIFLEVIEHLPVNTEIIALKEINRILKNNGTLVISTPNDNFFTKNLDPAYWVVKHRHYKFNNLKKILEKASFKIEDSFIGGGLIELMWVPLFYILKRLRLEKKFESIMGKIINNEYKKPGFYTIILKCRK